MTSMKQHIGRFACCCLLFCLVWIPMFADAQPTPMNITDIVSEYIIESYLVPGRCLQMLSPDPGSPLTTAACSAANYNQRFSFLLRGASSIGNLYTLVNKATATSLSVPSIAIATPLQGAITSSSSVNQQFTFQFYSTDSQTGGMIVYAVSALSPTGSFKVLNLGATTNDAVMIYDYFANDNQKWVLRPIAQDVTGTFMIRSPLNATSGIYTNRGGLCVWNLNGNLILSTGQDSFPQGTQTTSEVFNDVWSSPDLGYTWTRLTSSAPFTGRYNAAEGLLLSPATGGTRYGSLTVAPSTTLLVLAGGFPSSTDVWVSPDGVNWGQAAVKLFSRNETCRSDFGLVAVSGVLYAIGGCSYAFSGASCLPTNDVYRSVNGSLSSWTAGTGPFAPRSAFGVTTNAAKTRIILAGGIGVGGTIYNDVWLSNVGVTDWQLVAAASPWPARSGFGLLMVSGYVYLTAGKNGQTYFNDLWVSPDEGASWMQITANAGFSGRAINDNLVSDGNRMIVTGGHDITGNVNDLWFGYLV